MFSDGRVFCSGEKRKWLSNKKEKLLNLIENKCVCELIERSSYNGAVGRYGFTFFKAACCDLRFYDENIGKLPSSRDVIIFCPSKSGATGEVAWFRD